MKSFKFLMLLAGLTLAMPYAGYAATNGSFEEYEVGPVKYIVAKGPDLTSNPQARTFRTRLNEGFKQPADLAQKYVVVQHGCGTQCSVAWIINKQNGKVLGPITNSFGVEYRLDSKLIVVDPYPSPCSPEDQSYCDSFKEWGTKTKYYLLENDVLSSLNLL